jgi:hypothetical protein
MDYHLEPARYETVVFTKLLARYEIIMECDWIGAMQGVVDAATTDLMDIEAMRLAVAGAFYNSQNDGTPTSAGQGGATANVQWHSLINTILRMTAWAAQEDDTSSNQERSVDQTKVNNELKYQANVTDSAYTGGQNPAEESAVLTDAADKKVMGLAALTGQSQYDPESLGQLINNSNMRAILLRLRNHGCFIVDEDKDQSAEEVKNAYVVNPRVQEQSGVAGSDAAAADGTPDVSTLLNKNDQIVFPINLKSVVGHTESGGDELIHNGAELEINITFKQSAAYGSLAEGHLQDNVTGIAAGTGDSSNVTNPSP